MTGQNAYVALPRSRNRGGLLLVGIVVAATRYLFSSHQSGFRVMPDEVANVGMAKVLAGGQFNLLSTPPWQPGLSTLLAPVAIVTDSPEAIVRAALGLNAIVGGLAAMVLVLITERLTGLGPRATLVISAGLSLTPAALFSSAHVWAEPLVGLAFVAALWACLCFVDGLDLRFALSAIGASAVGYLSHGRLLLLLASTTALVAIEATRRRRSLVAGVAIAFSIACYLAVTAYTNWIVGRAWEEPSAGRSITNVLRRAANPVAVLDAAIGQIWYLVVTSLLFFGVGLSVLVSRAVRQSSRAIRADAVVVLVLTVPLLALSILFMSDRTRPDYLIYGRYNDAIVAPTLAVGVGWFVGRWAEVGRRRRIFVPLVAAIVTLELGLLVRQLHGGQFQRGYATTDMIPGLSAVMVRDGEVRVLLMTATAIGGFCLLLVARSRGAAHVLAVATVIVLAAGVRSYSVFRHVSPEADWKAARLGADWIKENVRNDESIGVLIMPDDFQPAAPASYQMAYSLMFQLYAPDHRFQIDYGLGDDRGPYVVATTNDIVLGTNGGQMLFEQPGTGVAIWREP